MNMLAATKETISVHGFNGEDPFIYIGGKDKYMAKRFALNCAKLALLLSLALKELKQCRKIILLIKMALIQVCNWS